MSGFSSIGIAVLILLEVLAVETTSSDNICSQASASPCLSLLQQVQSRIRSDTPTEFAPSETNQFDLASSKSEHIPLEVPFYLKSAEHPELYVGPEDSYSASDYLRFSSSGMNSGAQFIAEDADQGRFYLRSVKHLEWYVGTEGEPAHFVWLAKEGRARFAVESSNASSRFYLKSGDYADAYMQGEAGEENQTNASLVFAPFVHNASIEFIVESVVGQHSYRDAGDVDGKLCDLPLVGGHGSEVLPGSAINVSSHNARDGNMLNKEDSGPDHPHGWDGHHSRINEKMTGWLPEVDDLDQWIEWDFGEMKQIMRIQTLGRPKRGKEGDDQWVSEYNISFTKDDVTWEYINHVFNGNHDRDTPVENQFDPPLHARKVRLYPTAWHSRICLRAELFGCSEVEPARPAVCGSCARCEAVPGEDEQLSTLCPLCAYGMLRAWPCNVTELCQCAKKEEAPKTYFKPPHFKRRYVDVEPELVPVSNYEAGVEDVEAEMVPVGKYEVKVEEVDTKMVPVRKYEDVGELEEVWDSTAHHGFHGDTTARDGVDWVPVKPGSVVPKNS